MLQQTIPSYIQNTKENNRGIFLAEDVYPAFIQIIISVIIVRKGAPAPPPPAPFFSRHPLLDPDCPPFKILVSPPLFFVPPSFKLFQTVPPTLMQPPTSLIQQTNRPWFKQISKGQFYEFNCHLLSKINFLCFESLHKQVVLIYGMFSGPFLDNLE